MKELIYLLIFGAGVGAAYFIYMSFEQKRAAKRKLDALKATKDYKELKFTLDSLKKIEKELKGDTKSINQKINEYNSKYGTNIPTYDDDSEG